jgi:hypothetical protein
MEESIFLWTPREPCKGRRYKLQEYETAADLMEAWTTEFDVNINEEERIAADSDWFQFSVWENPDIDQLIAYSNLEEDQKIATCYAIENLWMELKEALEYEERPSYEWDTWNDRIHEQRWEDMGYEHLAEQSGLSSFIDRDIVKRTFEECYNEFWYDNRTFRFAVYSLLIVMAQTS